jgi:hypothetical protein
VWLNKAVVLGGLGQIWNLHFRDYTSEGMKTGKINSINLEFSVDIDI